MENRIIRTHIINNQFLSSYPRLRLIETKDLGITKVKNTQKKKMLALAKDIGDKNFLLIPFLKARQLENGLFEKQIGGTYDRYLRYIDPLNIAFDNGFYTLSPQIADVIMDSLVLARFNTHILILGESGVGKSLLVKLIAAKAKLNVVPVNCAAIPEHLAESELFGHMEGAFTGANSNKVGFVEKAHEGILFLDEIHGLPLSIYRKLLRFLDTGEYYPVGSAKINKSKAKIILASNENLDDPQVRESIHFPHDLYSRIDTYPSLLKIPPIRNRVSDIPFFIFCIIKNIINRTLHEPAEQPKIGKIDHAHSTNTLSLRPTISKSFLQAIMYDKWMGNTRRIMKLLDHSWLFESHDLMLWGYRYFQQKNINLDSNASQIIKRHVYYELVKDMTPSMILSNTHPRTIEIFNHYGIGIDQLPYLDIRKFMKEDYLPPDAYLALSEQSNIEPTMSLNALAKLRYSKEDLLALYVQEVESTKGRELKHERAKRIGMTSKTYNLYLNRGKELVRTKI